MDANASTNFVISCLRQQKLVASPWAGLTKQFLQVVT
jgi:hypothetical protein